MEKTELKKTIARLLNEGLGLSEIQKTLQQEYKHSITFLDLRLLAAECEGIDWQQQDPPEEEDTGTQDKNESGDLAHEDSDDGSTVVEISKLTRPGAALSGSVTFASGASADWVLDQFGRIGLEKANGQPTPEDLEEFQVELQKKLGRGGI